MGPNFWSEDFNRCPGIHIEESLVAGVGRHIPGKFRPIANGSIRLVGLLLLVRDEHELVKVIEKIEGNLTGCVYSHSAGTDDELYNRIEPVLRRRVGRLLNDKMPTGVAVSSAMNHGGPYLLRVIRASHQSAFPLPCSASPLSIVMTMFGRAVFHRNYRTRPHRTNVAVHIRRWTQKDI